METRGVRWVTGGGLGSSREDRGSHGHQQHSLSCQHRHHHHHHHPLRHRHHHHHLANAERAGLCGQDIVQAGTFWGVLNVWLRASGAQIKLGIVVQFFGDLSDPLEEFMSFGVSRPVSHAGGPPLTLLRI